MLTMSWKTGENEMDRQTDIVKTTIAASSASAVAEIKADADTSAAFGTLAVGLIANADKVAKAVSSIFSTTTKTD
jgi:hypothetical protein